MNIIKYSVKDFPVNKILLWQTSLNVPLHCIEHEKLPGTPLTKVV